ncbi:uncharacterized protein LOC129005047 [Macrosteles quadrilineatus]|uniref:uncharacterized protein LOC129005047 n=1 Tax=Macrosteles quadrilineatus TaxID=74068 RepID=UPI0023E30F27|nr:uncharacterized protein LOC129005047 [Macrosteles quadrilineatus]
MDYEESTTGEFTKRSEDFGPLNYLQFNSTDYEESTIKSTTENKPIMVDNVAAFDFDITHDYYSTYDFEYLSTNDYQSSEFSTYSTQITNTEFHQTSTKDYVKLARFTLKINNVPLIVKEKMTEESFEEFLKIDKLKSDWCVRSIATFGDSCGESFELQINFGKCFKAPVNFVDLDLFVEMTKSYWYILLSLFLLTFAVIYFSIHKCWKRNRKVDYMMTELEEEMKRRRLPEKHATQESDL